ncbi:glutathione S-transferase T3-like [Brassica napus]|uniref:glutathione S-transferase T3-like n=1 Tax=Brassica napus TaxID=3708 RepID=UPI0020785874|nr:glutathione S-transferase T3-like [Brassica napus]
MEPFSTQTSGFISLLASQSSPFPDCDPPQAVANSPGLMKTTSKRKWSTKEDLVLISGWVNTSKDPIVSNEQKITSFWRRIEAYVNSSPLLTGSAPREWGQCKQRWGRVNDQVCKFVGSYDAALKNQSSGQNDDDVMKAAHEIFFNDYQAKFTMEHCWRELRHDQKWKSVFKSRDGGKEKTKEAEEVMAEGEVRPAGVKAAKAAKRKRHGKEVAFDQIETILAERKKISQQKILQLLLAKIETDLTPNEITLKQKLISELLD